MLVAEVSRFGGPEVLIARRVAALEARATLARTLLLSITG
jgi:hypothetical protein